MATTLTTSARDLAAAAKQAAPYIARATTAVKNAALHALADGLHAHAAAIIAANNKDLAAATTLSPALKDRLALNESRIAAMADSARTVAALSDPVGEINDLRVMPSGIRVGRMRVPLGVILAIYESRPNVTADIAMLALKSGNAAILRGGSEAQHSNAAIGACVRAALRQAKLPLAAVVVAATSRKMIDDFLACADSIDLVIPRGGRALIERVSQKAKMPTLKHLDGNCHVYVDAAADLDKSEQVVINAKTRRYGVCSAAESLLVHASVAAAFLPRVAASLLARGVKLCGCPQTRRIIGGRQCRVASEEDWRTEYLAPMLSIKVVPSLTAAIAHINRYGSAHTDAIMTDSATASARFLTEVDSASVMVNASTAFADGGEYGLGAEVGISTDKLHARGPVGLRGLTGEKYIVLGDGHVRD
ncbi:MAG: glutamate-5-semialdehyde dehydrogenase [Gammaproteobacteria bacterium]